MSDSSKRGDSEGTAATHRQCDRLAHAGLFARKTRWEELNRAQRHVEIVRALAVAHPDWTFCSFSAACLLGLEVSWRHLNVVHVCSETKPSARPGARIQRHRTEPAGAIDQGGISITPPIQTVTDCLLQTGFADGMPIADSAISKLGLTREQLMEAVEKRAGARNGRAVRTALTTLQYADALAESGGESVARAVMIETGFAPDRLQYELTDPFDSTESMRTDFAWERQARELTLGELDGFVKYTDQAMLAGRTTAETLVAERQREAHLSLYGHPLIRFTMNEVRSAGVLAKKLQTAGVRQTALPTWLNDVDL